MKTTFFSGEGETAQGWASQESGKAATGETIRVHGLLGGVRELAVEVLLPEGHPPDLELRLEGPHGEELVLARGAAVARTGPCRLRFEEGATGDLGRAQRAHETPVRPLDSFSQLDDHAPNGAWTLRGSGTAFTHPLAWKLEIETGCHAFRSGLRRGEGVGELRQRVSVQGLPGLVLDSGRARVRLGLAAPTDLRLTLASPAGDSIQLARDLKLPAGEHELHFDDELSGSLEPTPSAGPWRGRPLEGFARLQGQLAEGPWTLTTEATGGAAVLLRQSLELELFTAAAHAPVGTPFPLRVRFHGGLNAAQRALVRFAALQWSQLLRGPHQPVRVDGEEIEGLLIDVAGRRIDGGSGVLGEAGPTHLRHGSLLPARGRLTLDSDDLARMERDGTAYTVVVHQIGHILGLGTLLKRHGYLRRTDSGPQTFIGSAAMREYARLQHREGPLPVPLEENHGGGARTHHWREEVFGGELMTAHAGEGAPSSRVTLAALEDLGFEVDLERADPFRLSHRGIKLGNLLGHTCATRPPEPVLLGEASKALGRALALPRQRRAGGSL